MVVLAADAEVFAGEPVIVHAAVGHEVEIEMPGEMARQEILLIAMDDAVRREAAARRFEERFMVVADRVA